MRNPFSTTFGLEPANYIQRLEENERILNDFTSETPSNYVFLITGVRGSGKTVMLTNISNELAKRNDWIVVDSGPKLNLLENIASELYENGKMKHLFLKAEFNFSFQGVSFSLKGQNPISSVLSLLKKMLEHVKGKGKRVLITLDEVDNSSEMKYFIQTYQSLIRQGYPLMLLMTGLYENVSRLQDDKSLTFLYRAPKIQLGALPLQIISSNYKQHLDVDDETSVELAKLTNGYAYAYQVLGFLLYESGEKKITNDLLNKYDQYLFEYVYEKIFSELSAKEQEILLSMRDKGKVDIASLRENTGLDTKNISVYRNRLMRKGLVVSPCYGYLEFALPRFDEFLKTM